MENKLTSTVKRKIRVIKIQDRALGLNDMYNDMITIPEEIFYIKTSQPNKSMYLIFSP